MAIRRTAPGWVRSMDQVSLHGLAGKLRREWWAGEASQRQDWLLEQVLAELEWRSARPGRGFRRCVCELCMPPFPWDQGELEF